MSKQTLAFIGGSGLYDINFLDKKKIINVNSKWGKPSGKIIQGKFHGKNIFFYRDMAKVMYYHLQI